MNSRMIAGIVIIVLGLGFLMDEMIGYSFGNIIADWWALIIVGFGIKILSDNTKNILNGIAVTLVGLIILLLSLDVIQGNLFNILWPVLLILAGIYFIAQKTHGKRTSSMKGSDFNITSIFSGNHQIIDTNDFKNGSVLALFGGAEIDLRNADITDEAFIDITCLFGGVEIKVPGGWTVKSNGTPILGGYENKIEIRKEMTGNMPVININFLVMFGSIEVKD